ncbi:hemolysin D [Croceibacterium mercuriale]|uniref:Hemolysin D n=1 Tax=Croceibacterium mercuriale TaxID=1572751 RepID=A0A0B2BRC8_9SPHN|nr:hemolysin D [Croceibacterium mercuriale]
MNLTRFLRVGLLGGLGACLAALSGCAGGEEQERGGSAPQVGFVTVEPVAVPISVTLAGRTVAYETSEVRPQVSGIIRRRLFVEGSFVQAGQQLYEIDDRLFRAAVRQAEANLASARATAQAAEALARRYKPLAEIEAVAEQDYTNAEAQAGVARAAVAQAQATLETARINLRFTRVDAPISGRIGRSLVTNGALANANQTQPLAVIQRLDPMFVDMQQSSAELTSLRRALRAGEIAAGSTTARLQLEDGSTYGVPGTVEFSEVAVDVSTGTVALRARFPNPQGVLLPGMFVTTVFDQAVQPAAFVVPQPAVQRDFNGSSYVYVVGPGNQALRRPVTTARTQGRSWVISAGLRSGDRVITQTPTALRHDTAVRPVPQDTPQRIGAPAAPAAAAPAD